MLAIGVLCSGGLGLSTLKDILEKYEVHFVLTDKNSSEIISYTSEQKIPTFVGNPRKGSAFNFVTKYPVDVIVSINYLFLIEEDIIEHPSRLTFNIHGSLLPKYRGRTPHVWAIIHGEEYAGITAHVIDKNCDTGDIIRQTKVKIEHSDTGADILKKYAILYGPMIIDVLVDVENDCLEVTPQDQNQATFYGKRTPDDGEIDWGLGKEEIRNWIRAQAYPYPGAYSFLEGEKIIIDKVSVLEDYRFESKKNGEIVNVAGKIEVKVKDGLVILEKLRLKNYKFEIGKQFTYEDRN